MKKNLFIFLIVVLASGVGLWLWRAVAPSPGKSGPGLRRPYVVGVVRTPPTLDVIWESFRVKMRELGYEEGRDVVYKVTEVGGDAAETKKKVAVLMDEGLDVIYPLGNFAVHAAKNVADERGLDLPIVFGILADPIKSKLVASLKSSGNNITGVVSANETVSSKRLDLFLEAVPGITRIVFPWNDPVTTGIETFRATAQTLGVTLAEKHVENVGELDAFLANFAFQRGDGLFRATDTTSAARVEQMARLALEKKIPLSGTNAFDVQRGALMSYGANYKKMGAQGAVLVDKILRGGKSPSDVPIELPAEFELVVNLTTARVLGIAISPDFLAKATAILP